MIKYLGSKRRLVPVLQSIAVASGARTAIDLFTGTTRVAQALKQVGCTVTAVDSARFAHAFARCYVETDACEVDLGEVTELLEDLSAGPPVDGYVTETFALRSRYFSPDNARRIDAARLALARLEGHRLHPVLVTALIEAADRVDSTTGVQMAYLKSLAPRALRTLELRVPDLVPGRGTAVLADACEVVGRLPVSDLAYLDPPYNQHRYVANYHVWETLAAGDEPDHFGVACKRIDLREPTSGSAFNRRRDMPAALAACVAAVPARTVVVSLSDESWVSAGELREMCSVRGEVELVSFPSRRYVGAEIGVHNPSGVKVGTAGRTHNLEHVAVCGELPDRLRQLLAGLRAGSAEHRTPTAMSDFR